MVQNYKVSRSVSNLDVVLDFYVDTLGSSIVHQVGLMATLMMLRIKAKMLTRTEVILSTSTLMVIMTMMIIRLYSSSEAISSAIKNLENFQKFSQGDIFRRL